MEVTRKCRSVSAPQRFGADRCVGRIPPRSTCFIYDEQNLFTLSSSSKKSTNDGCLPSSNVWIHAEVNQRWVHTLLFGSDRRRTSAACVSCPVLMPCGLVDQRPESIRNCIPYNIQLRCHRRNIRSKNWIDPNESSREVTVGC